MHNQSDTCQVLGHAIARNPGAHVTYTTVYMTKGLGVVFMTH